MNKIKTLNSIIAVIKHHEEQMQKLKDLVEGKSVENTLSISKTQCEFGKWLYSNDSNIQNIIGHQFYEKIDKLYTEWHEQYYKIYKIFYDEKKGFISKMFTSTTEEMKLDKAKLYYSELKITSGNLLKILSSSERRISAMNESKFN